jgi:hypothetical protein
VSDLEFSEDVRRYLGHLEDKGRLSSYRLTRRKLGLGPHSLGEFHIAMEFRDLAHLDGAFRNVARRAEPVESFHQAVSSKITDVTFALYRDFPEASRENGEAPR